MSDTDDRYQRVNLRIPRELHASLMKEADEKSRSMNAEIVARLEGTVEAAKAIPILQQASQQLLELVTRLSKNVDRLMADNENVRKENIHLREKLRHLALDD